MKAVPYAVRGVLLGLLSTSVHAQGPILATPGSATWATEALDGGGTRTVFTITENTVLDWNQFNLGKGNELVFDFLGGDSVVNNLNGTRTHYINGEVFSNGNVGFFSPNARLIVDGNITAKSITLATLGVDPGAFASGGDFVLTGADGERLSVGGNLLARDGDILLAGERLRIDTEAVITVPNGKALFAGGNQVEVSSDGPQRIRVIGTIGSINHNGSTAAGGTELVAAKSVTNNGRVDVGDARLFVEVGDSGRISNEGNGVLVGDTVFEGDLVNRGEIIVKEADALPAINESQLPIPELKRPDGTKLMTKRTVSFSAPVRASSDASRTSKQKSRQVAKVDSSKSLLRRSSFFGRSTNNTVATR